VPTAVLIDYNNLYDEIDRTLDRGEFPDEVILDMISLLPQFALSEWDGSLSVIRAYADFGLIEDGGTYVQQQLSQRGVDPRIVVAQEDEAAPRLRLCIEAADLVNQRPDIEYIVVLTGLNTFDALANFVGHRGRRLAVLSIRTDQEEPEGCHPLLSFGTTSSLLTDHADTDAAPTRPETREPSDFLPVRDPVLICAIGVISDDFGQYDEVYLTPLLRKLTEVLGEAEEPKRIIADLQDAGAVRLEKRKGYPHDYTVLIVDERHPDVAAHGGTDLTADAASETVAVEPETLGEQRRREMEHVLDQEPTGDGSEDPLLEAEISVVDSPGNRVTDSAVA
jgi:hypothetical protein